MHDRNSHLRVCSLSREVEGSGCRVVVEELSTERSVLRRQAQNVRTRDSDCLSVGLSVFLSLSVSLSLSLSLPYSL